MNTNLSNIRSMTPQSLRGMNGFQSGKNSFWENIFLARELEVLKSIYFFRVDVSDEHGPSSEHHSKWFGLGVGKTAIFVMFSPKRLLCNFGPKLTFGAYLILRDGFVMLGPVLSAIGTQSSWPGQQGCAGRGKIIHRLTLKTLNIKMYHTYFSKRAFQIILKVRILHHLPI